MIGDLKFLETYENINISNNLMNRVKNGKQSSLNL